MLLSFKPRFADMVVRGLLGDDTGKRQTIRAPRKDGRLPLPGEALHLYTGIRTKKCRKLGVAICESVMRVKIHRTALILDGRTEKSSRVLDSFAALDGFSDWSELLAWFDEIHGLPFAGHVIRWHGKDEGNG